MINKTNTLKVIPHGDGYIVHDPASNRYLCEGADSGIWRTDINKAHVYAKPIYAEAVIYAWQAIPPADRPFDDNSL